jgi:hypothetical protein
MIDERRQFDYGYVEVRVKIEINKSNLFAFRDTNTRELCIFLLPRSINCLILGRPCLRCAQIMGEPKNINEPIMLAHLP